MTPSTDPRPLLRASFDQSAAVIGAVRPDQMALITPCERFDVRTLVGHLLFAARRIAAAGARSPLPEGGPAVTGLADDAWAGAFRSTAAEAMAAWGEPGALDGDIALPFGTFPAGVVAQIYAMEQAAHAWDLARATQSGVQLDQALAEAVLPLAEELVTPEVRGPDPLPFGPPVVAAAERSPADRLAAHLGRHPDWAPAAAGPTRERDDLVSALAGARRFLRFTVSELSDEEVTRRTTASELCLGGVLKHVTEMERRWAQFMVEGSSALLSSDEAGFQLHAATFVVGDDETLDGLLADYEEVGRRTDALVRSLPDLDRAHPLPAAPWFEPGASWTVRHAALHIVAETAQHAGHADILRESLDGQKTMG
jgi:uncharacterized protein (TIGR03086 family)